MICPRLSLVTSRNVLTILVKWCVCSSMEERFSFSFAFNSGAIEAVFCTWRPIIWLLVRITVSGVRNSCAVIARNSSLSSLDSRMEASLVRAISASCFQRVCSMANPANWPMPSTTAISQALNPNVGKEWVAPCSYRSTSFFVLAVRSSSITPNKRLLCMMGVARTIVCGLTCIWLRCCRIFTMVAWPARSWV